MPISFAGKIIPNSLSEIVEPKRTALLIWDCQNENSKGIEHFESIVAKIKDLLNEARKKSVFVAYSQHTGLDWGDESEAEIRRRMRMLGSSDPQKLQRIFVEGTEEWQIFKELSPVSGEFVFKKHRPSAFVGTDFDLVLRNRGIRSLIVTGFLTEVGIEFTARHANALGYYVVVPEDCVGSRNIEVHNASIRFMQRYYEACKSDDVLKEWASLPKEIVK